MASMDAVIVRIKGKGGHGAEPHNNVDPVVIASHIIIALQQIVSRLANPGDPTVLSFGKVIANGAINVIPDEVYMEGTFRAMNEDWRDEAHRRMTDMAEGIAKSMGATCDMKIIRGFPFLINEAKLTAEIKTLRVRVSWGRKCSGRRYLDGGRGFCLLFTGGGLLFLFMRCGQCAKGITSTLHSPTFNIDENALEVSAGLMAYLALKRLGN